VKRTPTLSLAAYVASVGLLVVASPLGGVAATPQPTSTPAKTKDACSATQSKWAHLKCEQFKESAPGDEYFGRMKMSYLGIDNTYKDGAISAGVYTTDPKLISKLDFATEALQRWAAKYPNDPELARSYYLGYLVMQKVYTKPEQERTWQFMQIIVHKYPNTYFGKQVKSAMASGFTEHWFADAQACPPATAGAKPDPTATPMPATADHPAVQVMAPPCTSANP